MNYNYLLKFSSRFFLLLFVSLIRLITYGQNWDEILKAKASDRSSGDEFGRSVSISGNYAVIGAKHEDHDTMGMNSLNSAGSAYIFERNSTGDWIEVQKIVASDRADGDEFGHSVCISGDYIIVGAYKKYYWSGGIKNRYSGSAYIFERDSTGVWNEVQIINASDRAAHDCFGLSVSISGDFAIIGAPKEDHDTSGLNAKRDAGSVYLYKRNGSGGWDEIQKILASDRDSLVYFGSSVSISGDFAIIGAYGERHDTMGMNFLWVAGSAYIFKQDSAGDWNEVQKIVASDREAHDQFGTSVSISGGFAIIGARGEDHDTMGMNFLSYAGCAYIFEQDSAGDWNEVQKIVSSDREEGDEFGISVSISGDYALIGAYYESHDTAAMNTMSSSGSAYLLARNGSGIWKEVQKFVASDRASGDRFGISVSISGNNAIIGAYGDGSIAGTAITALGSAYIFEANQTTDLGFVKADSAGKLKVYPNPSNGSFTIDFGHSSKSGATLITDVTGRVIHSGEFTESNLHNLQLNAPPGIYLLIIETDDLREVLRIVKR